MKYIIYILVLISFIVLTTNGQEKCEIQTIKAVIPHYPLLAIALNQSGQVKVEVIINKEVKVIQTKGIKGPNRLFKISEKASEEWQFSKLEKNSSEICSERKSILFFNYVLLPSSATQNEQSWSFVNYPNTVEIRKIEPELKSK